MLDNPAKTLTTMVLGGRGSGHFGHKGRSGQVGGSDDDVAQQEMLAARQHDLLAKPDFVIGLPAQLHGDAQRYVAAYGQRWQSASLPPGMSRGTPQECYKNASLLALENDSLEFVEGFAKIPSLDGLVFAHAWNVDKTGKVIDITWDKPEEAEYFGVKYDKATYLKHLYTAKRYGVLGGDVKAAKILIRNGAKKIRALGGPGSGNFGHAGRPGQVGGSTASKDLLGRGPEDYPPSRKDGLDTRERFSDGHGNYTKERQELHQAIINKYLAGTTPVEKPIATIIGGGMASGKSTLMSVEKIGSDNSVLVNVDEIRNDLPEYAADENGKRPVNVSFTHEEASDISKKLLQAAIDTKRNLTLDGAGDTTLYKLGGKIAAMRARGHKIVADYVTVPLDVAQKRSDERGQKIGRFVPPTALREVHKAVSGIFPEAIRQGLFDKARLWDTHNVKQDGTKYGRPTLVAMSKGRDLTILNPHLWAGFLSKADIDD